MSEQLYPIVIVALSDEEGGFLAYAPDLMGCMSDGATREEALQNVSLAVGEWIDEAQALGREIPTPNSSVRAATEVSKNLQDLVGTQDKLIAALKEQVEALQKQISILEKSPTPVDFISQSSLQPVLQRYARIPEHNCH